MTVAQRGAEGADTVVRLTTIGDGLKRPFTMRERHHAVLHCRLMRCCCNVADPGYRTLATLCPESVDSEARLRLAATGRKARQLGVGRSIESGY